MFSYKRPTKMLNMTKFCLKTYNLQNRAIKVIIIKTLVHLRRSHTEVSLKNELIQEFYAHLTKNIYEEVPPDSTAGKVI